MDEISLQVQRLALVEVQKLLIEGDVDEGTDLLSQWEHYLEVSNCSKCQNLKIFLFLIMIVRTIISVN